MQDLGDKFIENRNTRLAPDNYIDIVLKTYGKPWEKTKDSANTTPYWTHNQLNDIENNKLLNDILTAALGIPIGVPCSKAIAQMSYDEKNNVPYWPNERLLGISPDIFFKVIAWCGLEEHDFSEQWYLPVMPGLGFLMALRQLLWMLEVEGAPASGIHFKQYPSCNDDHKKKTVHRVTVFLQKKRNNKKNNQEDEHTGKFDHELVFLIKTQNSNNQIPSDGLSEAIWDVAHCRLSSVENPHGYPWLELFRKGTEKPIVNISFSEHAIHFTW